MVLGVLCLVEHNKIARSVSSLSAVAPPCGASVVRQHLEVLCIGDMAKHTRSVSRSAVCVSFDVCI